MIVLLCLSVVFHVKGVIFTVFCERFVEDITKLVPYLADRVEILFINLWSYGYVNIC